MKQGIRYRQLKQLSEVEAGALGLHAADSAAHLREKV